MPERLKAGNAAGILRCYVPNWLRGAQPFPLDGLTLMCFVFFVARQDKTTRSQIANRAVTGDAREGLVCQSRRSSSLAARNSSLVAFDRLDTTSTIAGTICGALFQLC